MNFLMSLRCTSFRTSVFAPMESAKSAEVPAIPGCATQGKVFVGQRQDPFAVNLGVIFDLINVPSAAFILDPANKDAAADSLSDKNVTTLALEKEIKLGFELPPSDPRHPPARRLPP